MSEEPAKAGFSEISEVGKSRLQKAGRRLVEEAGLAGDSLDVGFRALRIDSTNKSDTLRTPDEVTQGELHLSADSIRPGRNTADLLFQVFLDWGLSLDLPIDSVPVGDGEAFDVDSGTLLACFADVVTDAVVRAIAERGPLRAVFRDSAFASDAARINAEQVFREVSPDTEVKVI